MAAETTFPRALDDFAAAGPANPTVDAEHVNHVMNALVAVQTAARHSVFTNRYCAAGASGSPARRKALFGAHHFVNNLPAGQNWIDLEVPLYDHDGTTRLDGAWTDSGYAIHVEARGIPKELIASYDRVYTPREYTLNPAASGCYKSPQLAYCVHSYQGNGSTAVLRVKLSGLSPAASAYDIMIYTTVISAANKVGDIQTGAGRDPDGDPYTGETVVEESADLILNGRFNQFETQDIGGVLFKVATYWSPTLFAEYDIRGPFTPPREPKGWMAVMRHPKDGGYGTSDFTTYGLLGDGTPNWDYLMGRLYPTPATPRSWLERNTASQTGTGANEPGILVVNPIDGQPFSLSSLHTVRLKFRYKFDTATNDPVMAATKLGVFAHIEFYNAAKQRIGLYTWKLKDAVYTSTDQRVWHAADLALPGTVFAFTGARYIRPWINGMWIDGLPKTWTGYAWETVSYPGRVDVDDVQLTVERTPA